MRTTIRAAILVLVVLVVVIVYKPIRASIENAVHNWVGATVETAAGPGCTTAGVTLSIGTHHAISDGGTEYTLVLANHTTSSCSLSGAPAVFWTGMAGGAHLGHPAAYVGAPQVGYNAYHSILPYQQVSILLRVTNVDKWSAACVPVRVRYVAVRLGPTTWETTLPTTICSGLASVTVSAVTEG